MAPTAASIAAGTYPQSSRICNASTLFATTAHPRLLAAAGTSYSQITIRIGNSFVELDTNNAVDTELGLLYVGKRFRRRKGERGLEVRKRIAAWKARVEREQRMRKKTYWKTMGCCARRPKLEESGEGEAGAAFSMRAQVR
jgi:hypothetical protein